MDDEPERESRKVKVTLGWVVEKAVQEEHASSVLVTKRNAKALEEAGESGEGSS
jgi:hypothetical protein